MRSGSVCKRAEKTSKIAISSLYETVLRRAITEAIKRKSSKTSRLNPTDIRSAVTEDEALRSLFGDAITLVGGGYRRTIIPRSKEKYARDIEDAEEEEVEEETETAQ